MQNFMNEFSQVNKTGLGKFVKYMILTHATTKLQSFFTCFGLNFYFY